jgi:hypothetical protein
MKEIIIIQMEDALAVTRALIAEEDAEDTEEAEEVTAEEAATIVRI